MVRRIIVITGTDTDVGKTVLTALLAGYVCARGGSVAALKPICSGGRADARVLQRALRGALALDEINPWPFRAPLAPLLAARKERQRLALAEVVAHVQSVGRRVETVLVEGAGGLLSPLGERFSTRELIVALNAETFVVAKNQLGVVNQVRLTLEALSPPMAARARVVLMSPERNTAAGRANPKLLAEFIGATRVSLLPWFQDVGDLDRLLSRTRVRRVLDALLR